MTSRVAICGLLLAALAPAAVGAQSMTGDAPGGRLTLAEAVRLATGQNTQVQTAVLEVQKADAEVATARSRRLPTFQTEVSASQLLTGVDFAFPQGAFGTFPGTGPIPSTDTTVSVPRQPTAYVSSQVAQPLTQLVQIGLGVKSAQAGRAIGEERVRAARLATVNAVKRLYFAILQTESAMAANDEAITLYRELDRTLLVRVAQKVALKGDSLDVQLRLAQAELTRTTYENTVASQKEQLNQLLGRDVQTAFTVEPVTELAALEFDAASSRAAALASRPDVREARLTLERAEFDRRIAKADRLPEVSLALSYTSNFNIDLLPANMASLGVQVKWEPFDWGRRSRELAVKAHTVQQAKLGVRDAEDKTVIEVNSRLRTLAEKRALLNVAQLSQGAAKEKLRVASNQYQVQAALLPDVLKLRADVANTDDDYQQALMAFWTAKADFEQAVGEDVIP